VCTLAWRARVTSSVATVVPRGRQQELGGASRPSPPEQAREVEVGCPLSTHDLPPRWRPKPTVHRPPQQQLSGWARNRGGPARQPANSGSGPTLRSTTGRVASPKILMPQCTARNRRQRVAEGNNTRGGTGIVRVVCAPLQWLQERWLCVYI
jgi:hypothetical protein